MHRYTIITDGSAKDAHLGGISHKTTGGVIVRNDLTKEETQLSVGFGPGSSQEAEYKALIAGLYAVMRICNKWSTRKISVIAKCDCKAVVDQIKGDAKVRCPKLKPLRDKVIKLVRRFGKFSIYYLPRAQNGAHALT